jgi:hypothetical protein
MKNYTERALTIIDPTTHDVVATIPAEGVRVVAVRGDSSPATLPGVDFPVTHYSKVIGVDGLPEEGDIIVPLVVAEALRSIGGAHKGRVFTPAQLVFGPDRQVVGAPGLIYHGDVSSQ